MKRREPQPQQVPETGPWISLGAGRYRSKSTGRLRYVPHEDPQWNAAMKRLAAGKVPA